jgi:hypothetical protein
MARFFDVTTPVTTLELDSQRTGEVAFTVSNATTGALRGESVVVPSGGAQPSWFTVRDPVRAYPVGDAEQITVSVTVPLDAPGGPASFRLRTLLGGGVPEEDYDDSPQVRFEVPPAPAVPPPKKPFPWWILLVAGAILALLVLGGVGFVLTRPGASPTPPPSPLSARCPGAPSPPALEFLPDLEILNVLSEMGPTWLRVFALVNNNAVDDGAAGPFLTRFRLDRQVRDWYQADGLLPGAQFTAEAEFDLTGDLVGFVVVDPDDCVFEFDETNNTRRY